MKVNFIEHKEHLFRDDEYRDLGTKEMSVIPQQGDVIKGAKFWRVVQRTFVVTNNPDEEDYVKLFLREITRLNN